MRHVAQILQGRELEWIRIAQKFIHDALSTEPQKKEWRNWSVVDGILLVNDLHIGNLPMVWGMLKGWTKATHASTYI